MKNEPKDKKTAPTSWIGKTATMAAVVAALGISLGVNVQKVYAGEVLQNSGVVQDKSKDLSTSQQDKIKSQQKKLETQKSKIQSREFKLDTTQGKLETK
jgi:uncharacterized protein HemX